MSSKAGKVHSLHRFGRLLGRAKKGSGGMYVMRKGKLVRAVAKNRDNDVMTSTTMGCTDRAEQLKRLALFAGHGVNARYHPATGQLVYEGGYRAQRTLARLHGLEID